MKSANTVYDELNLVKGKAIKRIGVVDLGSYYIFEYSGTTPSEGMYLYAIRSKDWGIANGNNFMSAEIQPLTLFDELRTKNGAFNNKEYNVLIPLTSKFNVYNYLTMLSIVNNQGFTIEEIITISKNYLKENKNAGNRKYPFPGMLHPPSSSASSALHGVRRNTP